jgi:hypothetical protein
VFSRRVVRDEQGNPVQRRREGRGLGPFTSGHLTIVAVTVVIVVAFPFAAFAVTGNNVFVTDATSGNRATVASGKLKVDTGLSTFGVVPTASVGGSLNATPAPPSQQYVSTVFFNDAPPRCKTLVTPPSGKAVVITTVHFQARDLDAGPEPRFADLGHSGSGGCTTGNVALDGVSFEGNVPAGNMWQGVASQQLEFPSGLAVANGHTLTVSVAGGPDDNWRVTAIGYVVAANQCTTGCL